ncbi:MAG: SagB/ThcOx family dehydrogenase [Phycisphaerales bacterium]|nr:MAG: SagB/ThcOx family dehydrogenase [Phycisphaerales bacterium]
MDDVEAIIAYHERTKHHPHRYAAGPGGLDWANQPDPFRRFEGAPLVRLPLIVEDKTPPYRLLYERGAVPAASLTTESLSRFLECSLAISAWKSYGASRWALRVNPSSGNLHPTEGYVILGGQVREVKGPGVYHYRPREHALERRCRFTAEQWGLLTASFPAGSFLVGLSSVHWREAWKYGERAFRYCNHDVGHAVGALRMAAAMLGWQLVVLEGLPDEDVAVLLGLNREEDFAEAVPEEPDLIAVVCPAAAAGSFRRGLPGGAARGVAEADWTGKANRLSVKHKEWAAIEAATQATRKPATEGPECHIHVASGDVLADDLGREGPSARQIVLQRRSGVAFDGTTGISAEAFYRMMERLVPGSDDPGVPWDCLGWSPRVHLLLFVHLVEGLPPGLYVLTRDAGQMQRLREAMKKDFAWARPEACPQALPLYLLVETDCRRPAAQVSLGQDIAGDSAFSLGMVADFERSLGELGGWFYRRLFWEAGLVGHVLYLEAEAARLRGTGIGAYFDDAVHDMLGLEGRAFQSLYHFTVGGAVEDPRLTTEEPYPRDEWKH